MCNMLVDMNIIELRHVIICNIICCGVIAFSDGLSGIVWEDNCYIEGLGSSDKESRNFLLRNMRNAEDEMECSVA